MITNFKIAVQIIIGALGVLFVLWALAQVVGGM